MIKMQKSHKILFVIAVLLAIISWIIAIFYWDSLPDIIPIHFGISGQADGWANKSVFQVFMVPFIQLLMTVGFIFIYYKPQYSDMPTTMWLITLEKKHQDHAFKLIRIMIAGMSVWIGIMFTYLTYAMNQSAIKPEYDLSTPIMMSIIGFMLIWLIFWTVRVYKTTKKAISSIKNK
ncbi:MAG TPA: DUF1648 domain-containing protein [Candidatus Saccharibacteria bacterium]|nr:DUF1648 domain-containing protein [Candidatus Saccharibacteria bacterium]